MKQTLIKITDDHYVVVDDSQIKEDCYALHEGPLGEREIVTANGQCKLDKKITHSTQPFEHSIEPFADGVQYVKIYDKIKPLSLQEVKELIGEVDVEKKAEKFIGCEYDDIEDSIDQIGYDSFIRGYNQALEDNKDKKYTEKDIIGFYYWLKKNYGSIKPLEEGQIRERTTDIGILNKYIQSLQPKTQWEVTFDEQDKLKLV